MNWEIVSAVTQSVGLVLVLASLFYVARQVKQNTDVMRNNAAGERLERDFDLVVPIIESKEFAQLWLSGGQDFDSLDAADRERLMFFERRAITLWHHMYQLRQQGLLPDANWHEQCWVIQNIGRRQAVRAAWSAFGAGFAQEFQDFVNDQFAREKDRHPVA